MSALLVVGAGCFDGVGSQNAQAHPEADEQRIPASAAHAVPGPAPRASAVRAEDDDPVDIDRLVAAYAFSGGDRERQRVADAIEDVVSEMNILARSIARERLTGSNTVASALKIQRDAERITLSLDERVYTGALDGPPVKVTNSHGDVLRMTFRFRNGGLVQNFKGERGGRINSFSVDGNGRLKMKVKVHSPKLPKDLVYRLSYRRND